jgi:hypothetical protein
MNIDESLKLDTTVEEITDVFEYLDELRESGVTNMFGAATYIADEFGMDIRRARKFLTAWMKNF